MHDLFFKNEVKDAFKVKDCFDITQCSYCIHFTVKWLLEMKAYRCHSENGGENWIMQWSSAELIFSSQLFPNFCTCLTKYNHTHSQPWITQLWMELNAPFFCFPPLAWRREHETPQLKTHQKQWPQVCMVHEDIERYRKEAKPVWKNTISGMLLWISWIWISSIWSTKWFRCFRFEKHLIEWGKISHKIKRVWGYTSHSFFSEKMRSLYHYYILHYYILYNYAIPQHHPKRGGGGEGYPEK